MNVDQVVQTIRKACKGFGTDEAALIGAIVNVAPQDLYALNAHFKSSFGKDLGEYIRSETGGQFGKLLAGACQPEPILAAATLQAAMKGVGTDEKLLIETLVGRSNWEMNAIKQAYGAAYQKNLEEAVKSEVSGDLKKFFVSLLQASRDEQGQFMDIQADVEALYKAGEGKIGTDETEFLRIVNQRNEAHLARVYGAYMQKHGKAIEKVIKKEFGGKMEDALVASVQFQVNRGLYFAELLESAMKGLGTDEDKLNRLVLRLRGTPSMQWTKDAYMHTYGKTLEHRIKGETSGDHEKLLLALINQPARP